MKNVQEGERLLDQFKRTSITHTPANNEEMRVLAAEFWRLAKAMEGMMRVDGKNDEWKALAGRVRNLGERIYDVSR